MEYKYVDIQNSPRKNIYNLFRRMDYPYCGLCANVDITQLYQFCKKNNLSIFRVVLYLTSLAANQIKEFKYRFYGDKVIEYDLVHPSYTIMTLEDAFNFCTVEFQPDFEKFNEEAVLRAEELKGNIDLEHEENPDRDDLLFVTCVPWVSYTNVLHPVHMHPVDSIPRISWGKYFDEGGRKKMPLGVQGNHALIDGSHFGKFYKIVQEYFEHIDDYIILNRDK